MVTSADAAPLNPITGLTLVTWVDPTTLAPPGEEGFTVITTDLLNPSKRPRSSTGGLIGSTL
jgi:hypothetical protein